MLTYDKAPLNTKLLVEAKPTTWSAEFHEIVPSTDPENPFPDRPFEARREPAR